MEKTTRNYMYLSMKELRRNNMGWVTLGQIDRLADYIRKSGKERFTKDEITEIIGETLKNPKQEGEI